MTLTLSQTPSETIELDLLLDAIHRRYHYDFRGYSRASVRRRVEFACQKFGCATISALQDRILHDPALLPDLIKPVVTLHAAGRRAEAAAAYARILPLINYENRQCGLRATKTVMMAGGVIKSDAVRHPLRPLDPATREGLLELAREADVLALRWGK